MSRDTNNFTLIGRLTRDAEIKYTNGGLAIASFSIAVNRQIKQGEQWVDEPSFFDLSLFGKRAEGLAPYLLKAQQVAVQGELKQERWEKDGEKKSKVALHVSDLQLLGSGKNMREKVAMPEAEGAPNEPTPQELGIGLGGATTTKRAATVLPPGVHEAPFADDLIF